MTDVTANSASDDSATNRLSWVGPEDDWVRIGDRASAWCRGYAFTDDGRALQDIEIARYLLERRGDLESTLERLNGCFSVAVEAPPNPFLATDRYATIPLYLHESDGGLLVSADPWSLSGACESPPEIDELALVDLLRAGYVMGPRTLLSGIRTLGPSTLMELTPSAVQRTRYWHYSYQPQPADFGKAKSKLADVFARVGRRTCDHLDATQSRAALTLSGGLDSRVLAAVLGGRCERQLDAISYGAEDNPEVGVARQVAGEMGLRFQHIRVSSDYLSDDFLASSVRQVGATTRFTCGLGVRHLDGSNLDVVIPGHTGDFVSGGHLPAQVGMVRSKRDLVSYLDFAHVRYRGSERALRRTVDGYDAKKRLTLEESVRDFDFGEDTLGLIDRWNVENRQRRLILMELRAYESVARWMLPFYDYELVDFFKTVPHDFRVGQRLYVETAKTEIFTGNASGLASVKRVGRSMTPNTDLPGRIRLLNRLQPLSGLFLRHGLAAYRDVVRTIRPKQAPSHAHDALKRWYWSDQRVRQYLLGRLEGVSLPSIRTRALASLLSDKSVEDRVFNWILVGVLTAQECLEQARASWGRQQRT